LYLDARRSVGVSAPWWRSAIVYQVYPRSFQDTNSDGIGDLPGVTARLDHLAWLGIDALSLNPVTASSNDDRGYNVSDYCAIHPDLGTLSDLDHLIVAAGRREIRVLLDLVPNHTSDRHPWFVKACRSKSSAHRAFYVWAEPAAQKRRMLSNARRTSSFRQLGSGWLGRKVWR
jgi:glycosidase